MSLTFHFHPLASYCQKALIALFENDTPFTPRIVDLGNETERAALLKLWPIGKFPVLRDEARDRTIPESSIIIEYLGRYYPGSTQLIPADAELALNRLPIPSKEGVRGFFNRAFFWTDERATIPYDLWVIAILAFVWMTPPDFRTAAGSVASTWSTK